MLLVATVQNLSAFHGLLGLAWIEVYALFPPTLIAVAIMQLARPGFDPRLGDRLPAALRLTLALQAAAATNVGVVLFASSPSLADSMWSWPLTDLTSKAIGTWLVHDMDRVARGTLRTGGRRRRHPGRAAARPRGARSRLRSRVAGARLQPSTLTARATITPIVMSAATP
jgi:hypothetical protein